MTQPTASDSILEGSLSEFNLIEVLQVLSVSRQYTRVELYTRDQLVAGSIFVKSNKVVQAASGALRGKEAFVSLFRQELDSFRVFRIGTPAIIPEPVGSLSHLLFEAIAVDDDLELVPLSSPPPAPPAPPPRTVAPGRATAVPPPRVPAVPPPRVPAIQTPKRTASVSGVHATKPVSTACFIAVASPKGGSGKTTVSLNLALSLARREHRVILVDGDLNGDVMSSIDGRTSPKAGVFDVLMGTAAPLDALRKTLVPNLWILPALGQSIPRAEVAYIDYRDAWKNLMEVLSQHADIVLVDTPAGMFGITHQILSACTHVLGVLQAEVIAQRSFTMFADGLNLLSEPERPKVLGVFLNMLQVGHNASIGVLERACENLPKGWLFETSIPRNPAFLDAAAAGVPLHFYDPKHPPAVSWLFDTLATEVVDRLALGERESYAPQQRFLA